jgi:hypothetical protein
MHGRHDDLGLNTEPLAAQTDTKTFFGQLKFGQLISFMSSMMRLMSLISMDGLPTFAFQLGSLPSPTKRTGAI